MSDEESIAQLSTGIDYALDYRGSAYCHVTPVQETQLDAMIQFLNAANEESNAHDAPLCFSNSDNCTHLIANTLATAGLTNHRPRKESIVAPGGLVLELIQKSEREDFLNGAASFFENPKLREDFERWGSPTFHHGSVIEKHLKRSTEKKKYDESKDLILSPSFLPYALSYRFHPLSSWNPVSCIRTAFRNQKDFYRYFAAESNSELRENLLEWQKRYDQILSKLDEQIVSSETNLERMQFNLKFKKWVLEAQAQVEEILGVLDGSSSFEH